MSLRTVSNVYSLVASMTGYNNLNITGAEIPLTNISGRTPGPLNAEMFVPFTAPNISAVGAGGGSVFFAPDVNTNLTAGNAPAPLNLTALNKTVPASGPLNGSATGPSAPSSSSSGARREVVPGGVAILGALFGSVMLFI